MPYWFWIESLETPVPSKEEAHNRREALKRAIKRYLAAGFDPPPQWLIELKAL